MSKELASGVMNGVRLQAEMSVPPVLDLTETDFDELIVSPWAESPSEVLPVKGEKFYEQR